ncbi:MAG TPA: recombination protein RecT [Thermotogota bacterium]|nr:recombination protein RecT [Thermotogota bacterium]
MTDAKMNGIKERIIQAPKLDPQVVTAGTGSAAPAAIKPAQSRAVSPYQNIQDLFKRMAPEIAKVLPRHIKSDHLLRVAMTEIRKNPKLLECSSQSLLGALMLSAQLGLEPGILGHAYLIPYYNNKTKSTEVQFQIGYKGYIDLVRRSGELQTLDVHEVCRGDAFEYEYGLTPKLMHRPALENRGAAYCYYAIAKFKDGGFSFLVMSVQDIDKYRKRSKSPDYGPWATDYDAMAKKTVIKQLAKYLPLSTEIQRSMTQDETTKKEYEDVFAAADETDWVDITTTPAEPEPAVTE